MVISEMLLTLGVVPLATANIPLYQRIVAYPSMPEQVANLGPLNEPNLEYLYSLSPTRILMTDWQAVGLSTLDRIAPITPLSLASNQTPAVDHAETVLRQLGSLCNRDELAGAVIARTRDRIEQSRTTLAGFDRPVFLCRFNRDGRHLAIFGGNGMLGDVLRRLDLRNAYEGRVNAISGGAMIPLSWLADNPDAVIIHFDRGQETAAAMGRLAENPLWHALPSVRKERVLKIPVIYPTGGPQSASRFAQALAETLPEFAHG